MRRFATVLLLGVLACRNPAEKHARSIATPSQPTPFVDRLQITEARPTIEEVKKAPLPQAREMVDGLYRLTPDRRFLAGVAAVKRILRGAETASIRLGFSGGRWSVACDGQPVGNLPEFPSYADARALLATWVKALASSGSSASGAVDPSIEGEIALFAPSHMIQGLASADRAWNRSAPDPRLALLAGRALTRLLLQGFDEFELTNDIAGQALAALAISDALGTVGDERDATLLGLLLGYTVEAREMATRLDARDPVRLYVEGKAPALQTLAEARAADPLVVYLAVRSAPGAGRMKQWESWVYPRFFSQENALATLHAELALDQFETNPGCAESVVGIWMKQMEPAPPGSNAGEASPPEGPQWIQAILDEYLEAARQRLRKKPEGLLRRFEEGLSKRSPTGPGPFWDSESDRAWARASFYSAVAVLGRHILDSLSLPESAAEYARFLQDTPPGIAADYVRWYEHLVVATRGENNIEDLIRDSQSHRLGFAAASRSFEKIQNAIVEQRKPVVEIVSAYARRLDTRPAARIRLIDPLYYAAQDPLRALALCGHCTNLAGSVVEAWYAAVCNSMRGDIRELLRVASDPAQTLERRTQSLEWLKGWQGSPNVKPEPFRATYRQLIEDSEYSRAAVAGYVGYLDRVSDFREQLRVVEGYLAHNPSESLIHMIYGGRRAHCLSRLGRRKEAWDAIAPLVEASGQAAIMIWGAEILWDLGRRDEALALARQVTARYPDVAANRAPLARMLWMAGRYSEAALEVGDPRFTISYVPWHGEFAEAFAEASAGMTTEQVSKAFQFLREQKISFWSLEALVEKLGQLGRHEQGFRLYSELPGKGSWEYPWAKARAYEHLRKWKGDKAAEEWILSNYDLRMVSKTVQVFYATGNSELLWLLRDPAGQPTSETWMLRAAAAVRDGWDRSSHRDALLEHFQAANASTDLRFEIGRRVLGLVSEEELLARPRTPQQEVELVYFLGLRALLEGRMIDAWDWLAVLPLRGNGYGYQSSTLQTEILQRAWKEGLPEAGVQKTGPESR